MKNLSLQQFNDAAMFFYELTNIKNESFIIENPNSNVLISAPHAIRQMRLGKIKLAEPKTVNYAVILNKLTDCNIIIKAANTNNDANFDESTPYKTRMEKLVNRHNIKFVIDLHSLAPDKEVLVNIGVYFGELLQTEQKKKHFDRLVQIFKLNNLTPSIDMPFAAGPKTIAYHFGKDPDIFAVQLEVNSKLAKPEMGKELNSFINACTQFIEYAQNFV